MFVPAAASNTRLCEGTSNNASPWPCHVPNPRGCDVSRITVHTPAGSTKPLSPSLALTSSSSGARARPGQTLQYQLRDKITAHHDLVDLAQSNGEGSGQPFASLVFSCNGRCRSFFGVPYHDATTLAEILGPLASAGFFCNGEIGPIGDASYLHGYTASVALFCE